MCCSFWMPVAGVQLLSLSACSHLLEAQWVPDAHSGCGFWWALQVSEATLSTSATARAQGWVCYLLWTCCWPSTDSLTSVLELVVQSRWLQLLCWQLYAVMDAEQRCPNKAQFFPEYLAWEAKLFENWFHFGFHERMGIALKLPTTLHDWDHLQLLPGIWLCLQIHAEYICRRNFFFRKAGQKPTLEQ